MVVVVRPSWTLLSSRAVLSRTTVNDSVSSTVLSSVMLILTQFWEEPGSKVTVVERGVSSDIEPVTVEGREHEALDHA